MNAPSTRSVEPAVLALALCLLAARLFFEIRETCLVLGIPLPSHPGEWLQVAGFVVLRPVMAFAWLFTAALLFFPILLLTRSTDFSKTGDLTKGTLAKGELDD